MDVSLAEELLLFGYNDVVGWQGAVQYENGLPGAVLVELALAGRVTVQHRKVRVIDSTPLGDSELDRALSQIAQDRDAGLAVVLRRMSGRATRTRLLDQLTGRGVLRLDQKQFLRVFTTRNYMVVDPTVKAAAYARIQQVIHGGTPDTRTSALLGLLWESCAYDPTVYTDVGRRQVEVRRAQLANRHGTYGAADGAIRAILAATSESVMQSRISKSMR